MITRPRLVPGTAVRCHPRRRTSSVPRSRRVRRRLVSQAAAELLAVQWMSDDSGFIKLWLSCVLVGCNQQNGGKVTARTRKVKYKVTS